MTRRIDPGCDGLDLTAVLLLVIDAERAHPTRVRPPSAHEVALNLEILRRSVRAGARGGVAEALA